MNEEVLKAYYITYLKNIVKVSESTVEHYLGAMRHISKQLCKKNIIKSNIFEVRNADKIWEIQTYLKSDQDFISLNTRGHHMYSVAIKHYYNFISGMGFVSEPESIRIMDVAIPKGEKKTTIEEKWVRSDVIKNQVIESSGYMCEINPNHITFTSQKTQKPYMEGHHVLPMKFQDKFENSLDVYANIVCLCPICHKLLHYGLKEEKRVAIDKIYFDRAERLASSGIKISKSNFEDLAMESIKA